MKKNSLILATLLALAAGLLASCAPAVPTQDPQAIAEAAVQTFEAGLTGTAAANPSDTPIPSDTPAPSATTRAETNTPAEPGEPTGTFVPAGPDDKAILIQQIPLDGAQVGLRDKFDVVWIVRNDGPTTWTPRYSIRYFSGANFGEQMVFYFPTDVPPGEEVRLAVDMIAPNYTGQFNTNWVLTNARGENFYPVNLQVQVVEGPTVTPTATSTPTPTPGPSPTKVEG